MRRLLIAAALWGLFAAPMPLAGQETGTEDVEYTDIPCPLGLNTHFNDYQPIPFGNHEFFTRWNSKITATPLPSWNWYYASPDRNPVSTDGKVRWEGAEIQVHCWRERNPYFIRFHYDYVAGIGKIVPNTGGETETGSCTDQTEFQEFTDYDPFASSDTREFDKCGSEAGSGEPTSGGAICGGSSELVYDYICIDVWDEQQGWVTWWCGVAAICK